MAISDTLFSAILSLDAYNRGYASGVGGLLEIPDVSTIGDATVIKSMQNTTDGFSGVAYNWNGRIVISFRGTDNLSLLPNNASDIYNGWVQGAGILSEQSVDAETFYKDVTGQTIFGGTQSNVLLMGHSLGGGLAGYIGAITGDSAVVFDDMPYAQSAVNRVILQDIDDGFTNFSGLFAGSVSAPVALPNGSSVTTLYTLGEILAAVRALGPNLAAPYVQAYLTGAIVSAGTDPPSAVVDAGDAIDQADTVAAAATAAPTLNAYSGTVFLGISLAAIDLHNPALLVLLQYASDNCLTAWQSVGPDLTISYFNSAIGTALGVLPGGVATPNAQMLTEIAYSALNEGTMPFGDTGIVALFHDADLLGTVFSSSAIKGLLTSSVESALTDSIVEYAGWLAQNADTQASHNNGIINDDVADATLRVDFSSTTWAIESNSPPLIVGENELINAFAALDLIPHGVGANDFNSPAYDAIYIGTNDAIVHTINAAADTGLDLIVADYGTDTIVVGTGEADIIGGGGTDTIDASGQVSDGIVQLEAGTTTDNVTMGSKSTLIIDNPAAFKGTIAGFTTSNTIDLAGVGLASDAFLGDDNVLYVGGAALQLDPGQDYSNATFNVTDDGNGGTDVTIGSSGEDTKYTNNPDGTSSSSTTDPDGTTTTITYSGPNGTGTPVGETITFTGSNIDPNLRSISLVGIPKLTIDLTGVTQQGIVAGFNVLNSNRATEIDIKGNGTQYNFDLASYDQIFAGTNFINSNGSTTSFSDIYFGLKTPLQYSNLLSSTTGTVTDVSFNINDIDEPVYSIQAVNADQAPTPYAITPFTFVISRTGDLSVTDTLNYQVTSVGGAYSLNNEDFGGIDPTGSVTFNPGDNSETISIPVTGNSSGKAEPFWVVFDGTFQLPTESNIYYDYYANNYATGTIEAPACYLVGTAIATPSGETPVETLVIGDLILSISGEARVIKWIGRRGYVARVIAGRSALWPIRFRAGSLGNGLPRRDLFVSGEHAMLINGLLISARLLTNGTTIVRERPVGDIQYLHIELETHDVILAEGAAAETFLDEDSRGIFHNASEFAALYPEAGPAGRFCAPRVEDGYELEAVRCRLNSLAEGQRQAA